MSDLVTYLCSDCQTVSPGVKGVLESLDGGLTDDQLRESIHLAVDRRVQEKSEFNIFSGFVFNGFVCRNAWISNNNGEKLYNANKSRWPGPTCATMQNHETGEGRQKVEPVEGLLESECNLLRDFLRTEDRLSHDFNVIVGSVM